MRAGPFDLAPWRYAREADAAERAAQEALQETLAAAGRLSFGERCFVSPLAGIDVERLAFGANCLVAAWAVLAGDLTAGSFCTFNSHAVLRGRVRLGDAVRIASHASIIGFEHVTDDLERPMFRQGIRRRGVEIGDDVWIGAGAIIVDGVRVGSHAIIGAGAVVTRDVPDYAVMVGNPARLLRDRRHPRAVRVPDTLRDFGRRVAAEWPAVLAAHAAPTGLPSYADSAGGAPGLRATCDAVEIAAMFGAAPPAAAALRARLLACQDPSTGLPRDEFRVDDGRAGGAPEGPLGDAHTAYLVLCVGYALECLGGRYPRHFAAVEALDTAGLVRWLDGLPWREQPWTAGAWVDSLATALWFNHAHHGRDIPYAPLFEWLGARCFPHTGLWSGGQRAQGWLQPVNGFYRLTRGSYAQFGLRVPYPESTIDTVLAHCRFHEDFMTRGANACNVLDALHALWLCGRASAHRREEARAFARRQVAAIVQRWLPGAGFAFAAGGAASLHGTEMWLAALFTAAALLGAEEACGYAPRGIHRLGALAREAAR